MRLAVLLLCGIEALSGAREFEEKMQERSLALYQKARDCLEIGDTAQAIEALTMAAEAAPHYKTYELLGECYLLQKEFSRAVLYLSAAVGMGRRQSKCRFLLAKALIGMDDAYLLDAAAKLDEALSLNVTYRAARELLDSLLQEHPGLREDLGDLQS